MLAMPRSPTRYPSGWPLRGLAEPGARRRRTQVTTAHRSRPREERFLGRHSPDDKALRAFGEAAESLVGRWADNGPDASQAAELCERARGDPRPNWPAPGTVWPWPAAPILEPGFDARLATSPICDHRRCLPEPSADRRSGGAEEALDLVTDAHGRKRDTRRECAAAEAAVRLARWLAITETAPATLADAATRMLRSWAWADRALASSPAPTPAGCRSWPPPTRAL